jgi:hypothetical protein
VAIQATLGLAGSISILRQSHRNYAEVSETSGTPVSLETVAEGGEPCVFTACHDTLLGIWKSTATLLSTECARVVRRALTKPIRITILPDVILTGEDGGKGCVTHERGRRPKLIRRLKNYLRE